MSEKAPDVPSGDWGSLWPPDLPCLCLFSPRTYIVLRPITHSLCTLIQCSSVNAYLYETFTRGLERALYTKPKTDRPASAVGEKHSSELFKPAVCSEAMKSKLHIYSPAITQAGALLISDLPTLFLHPYSNHSERIPHRLHKTLISRQVSLSLSLTHMLIATGINKYGSLERSRFRILKKAANTKFSQGYSRATFQSWWFSFNVLNIPGLVY